MSAPDGDLVEQYLDQLYVALRTRPREARRVLAEAEDHLRESVTEGLAAGLSEREAQEHAVSSFGSVRAVVRAHDARLRRLPTLAVLRDVFMAAWRLGAIGLVAVGASGLIAWVMNAAFGRGFVGGTPGAIRYSAADCQPLAQHLDPRAQLRAGRGAGEQQRRGVTAAGRGRHRPGRAGLLPPGPAPVPRPAAGQLHAHRWP